MSKDRYLTQLKAIRGYFEKTIACLEDEDAEFAPQEGMFTTAQQIAHAAQTIEWFMEGAFLPTGFNLDFESLEGDVRIVKEMADARAWWTSALEQAEMAVAGSAEESWNEPIRGELMGGMPRHAIFSGMADHTAHHRGALAVYARLCGRTPAMPYG